MYSKAFSLKNFSKNNFLFLVFGLLAFIAAHLMHRPLTEGTAPTIQSFERTLHEKEIRLNEEMELLAASS